MNRTTGQAAGGSGSRSRWGVSARSFSWSDPAAELFCTADISFDVPAAIGWTSSLSLCEFGTPHEDATRSFAEQMQLASHARAVALGSPDLMVLLQCTAAAALQHERGNPQIDSPQQRWVGALMSDTQDKGGNEKTAAFCGSDFTVLVCCDCCRDLSLCAADFCRDGILWSFRQFPWIRAWVSS